MRPVLSLLPILPLIISSLADVPNHSTQILDPTQPIYLGDVFWPPTMTFIAWLPSEDNYQREWCYRATDISNEALFSLGGVDLLQIHGYFLDEAYISREGKRWANCWVTPESGRIGACEGVKDYDCIGGQKFTGPGMKSWSCWVIPEVLVETGNVTESRDEIIGEENLTERLTDAIYATTTRAHGAAIGSSVKAAFTAGATGRL